MTFLSYKSDISHNISYHMPHYTNKMTLLIYQLSMESDLQLPQCFPINFRFFACRFTMKLSSHRNGFVKETSHFQIKPIIVRIPSLIVETHLSIRRCIVCKSRVSESGPFTFFAARPLIAEENLTRQISLFRIEILKKTMRVLIPCIGLRT